MKFDDIKKINDDLIHAMFTPIDEKKYGVRSDIIIGQLSSIRENLTTIYEVDAKGDSATWRDLKAARRADRDIVDTVSMLSYGIKSELALKLSPAIREALDASANMMGSITECHSKTMPQSSLEVVIADKIISDLNSVIENEKRDYNALKKEGATKEDIARLKTYADEARTLYSEGATMATAPQHKEELNQMQSYMGDLLDDLNRAIEEHKYGLEQNNDKQNDL